MAPFDDFFENRITESIAAFEKKGKAVITTKQLEDMSGEGVEDLMAMQGFGQTGTLGFNNFYSSYINKIYDTEVAKINQYNQMAEYPEIADVIEDACNESIIEFDDNDGSVIDLLIRDEALLKNKNICDNLYKEFNELFKNRIDIGSKLWDMFHSYMIDGRLYYERIINRDKPSHGIVNIKKLPSDSMDFEYEPRTGRITVYYQYLAKNTKRPSNRKEAESRRDVVVFNPEQIGFVDYGLYGRTKAEIFGFLQKAMVPYNQLKLLETSVIIYRIVRAPERLVFKIDTGQMPKDKALKFVEKVKTRFIKKQSYDASTGRLTAEPEVLSILENFWLPTSSDGRGSDITSIGGNAAGFKELDDIYYFARKLYRSLKYPISRISAAQENQEGNILFGGSHSAEISRDEIKWAKFLERQQNIICKELRDLFLLHLEFKGLKKEYNLTKHAFRIIMPPPSHYKDVMEQGFIEQKFNNYNALANNTEFSKYYLAKKYLQMTDEDFKENLKGFKLDKKFFPNLGMDGDMGAGPDAGFDQGQDIGMEQQTPAPTDEEE